MFQVLGDGSSLGTFTSSGTTLDFENWTLNASGVSTIKLVARNLGSNDWLSITEVRYMLCMWSDTLSPNLSINLSTPEKD